MWQDCLNVPLFIKDVSTGHSNNNQSNDVDIIVPITDVYYTALDIATCPYANNIHSSSLIRFLKKDSSNTDADIVKTFSDIEERSQQNYSTILIDENIATNYPNVYIEPSMEWVIESSDNDSSVEVYTQTTEKHSPNASTRHAEEYKYRHDFIFHYYNIQKPVAITYMSKYQIVYAYLTGKYVNTDLLR